MQSRRMSFVEALANLVIGYVISLGAQLVIYPLFGVHIGLAANIGILTLFTIISLLRTYILRRTFNWIHHRG